MNRFYTKKALHHQTSLTCLGPGDHQHCGLAGTGRVWGGSWVIPITHITLQHYNITYTVHPTLALVRWPGQEETRQEQD